ncbi:MAG: sulfatase-like hydrolase/transferase [Armatimonadetes bacterium]|nr:sulfatase-like hydrolase/transferase [Armatimonadota bacterium]
MPNNRPNILLLYTDQQRFDTIAALGNSVIQTPALDSLVREGVAFTSAYTASPVCVSARCSLLLGQWPHRTGCTRNMPMPQERVSLMELLADAGYQTHGVGKMHFAPDSQKLWGFASRDYSEELSRGPHDAFYQHLVAEGFGHVVDPQGVRSEFYYLPQPSQLPSRLHNSHWVADRSLDFLARRDRSRPFFLWSSFIKPHPPFESPVPWNRLYKAPEMPLPHLPGGYEELLTYQNHRQNRYKWRDQGWDLNLVRTLRAQYYAAISFVDYNVGRILRHLREAGELDDTLVIFTSDHGELLGDYGSFGKRSMLDAAAGVPLLVRYPARFAAAQVVEQVASTVDVLPTCLEAAGVGVPDDRDGTDLAAMAAGDCDRDGVPIQFSHGPDGLYALVTRDWKYVYSAPDAREWLFRREGALETRSVAGLAPYDGILCSMRSRLLDWFRRDGYEEPLDGDGWRHYPRLTVPPDPDAGLLFQEGAGVADAFPPGYRPRCNP